MDEVSINLLNLQGQPFFNGKLILREVANGNGAAPASVGVPSCQGVPPTRTSPPGNIDSTSAIGTNGHPLIPMSTGAMTLAPPLNNARYAHYTTHHFVKYSSVVFAQQLEI